MSPKLEWAIIIIAVLVQFILIFTIIDESFLFLTGLLTLIAVLFLLAFSPIRIFLVLTFYIACFEGATYLIHFPGLPLVYDWKIAYVVFILLIFFWLIYLSRNQENVMFNQMDLSVFLFIVIIIFSHIHGVINQYGILKVLSDGSHPPFYLAYFIFILSPLKKHVRLFYRFLLICSVVISLQFLYAFAQFQTLLLLHRIVSRHIHLAQFAIPFILTTLIYTTSRKEKIIYAILLPLPILAVIFSQQRALYASTVLTILFYIGLFLYTRRNWIINNIKKTIFVSIPVILSIFLLFLIFQLTTGGRFLLTLYFRFYVFLNFQQIGFDTSWRIRWSEIANVLDNFRNFWLFGQGFGAFVVSRARFEVQSTLDNAYVYLLWKTGIVGLTSFLYMHFVFFRRGFMTLRKKIISEDRIYLITAMTNTAGLMLIAFSNCSIAFYRFIFIWASLFACVEIIARKYDQSSLINFKN
jgi:hypothetical protein